MTVDAIVLAGGASTRFGGDKLAAMLDGRPVLHHALGAAAQVAERLVVVIAPGGPAPPVPTGLVGRIVIARDPVAYRGPLAGLLAGLEAARAAKAPDPVDIALVVGGDMPGLVPAVLGLMAHRLAADPSLGAITLESDPPCALPMAVRPGLAEPAARALLADDRRALRALLDRVPSVVVPAPDWHHLDPGGRTLADVDTPSDLGGG